MPDVLTSLYGGLGNQLFQYAATLRALRETGGTSHQLIHVQGHRSEPGISEFLDLDVDPMGRMDRARWVDMSATPGLLRPVLRRTAGVHERVAGRVVIGQTSPYDTAPRFPAARVKLQGWFQHPSWFVDDWQEVAGALLKQAPKDFEDVVALRQCVLHVRRGDYVRSGWDLPPSYYEAALATLRDNVDEVVVVSDEPFLAWFSLLAAKAGVPVRRAEPFCTSAAKSDFYTIAAASIVIASNSTFAWWGAAAATERDLSTRVLCPAPWVPNNWNALQVIDLGLPRWSRVPSGLPRH